MNDWEITPGETPIDPSQLKDKSLRTRELLNRAEAANIVKAYEKYYASKLTGTSAFSYGWLLRVHRDMFCDVWKFAGHVRTVDLTLGVDKTRVATELGLLAMDIAAWRHNDALALEQCVTLHHRGVHIHPFENGNGRWARFVANLWLRRVGQPEIEWPEPSMSGGESTLRNEYIAAIKRADEHDMAPLMQLHARFWRKRVE